MSAGGGLDAGRFDSDASAEMKTDLLDILQCYRLEMLTLGGRENRLSVITSAVMSS